MSCRVPPSFKNSFILINYAVLLCRPFLYSSALSVTCFVWRLQACTWPGCGQFPHTEGPLGEVTSHQFPGGKKKGNIDLPSLLSRKSTVVLSVLFTSTPSLSALEVLIYKPSPGRASPGVLEAHLPTVNARYNLHGGLCNTGTFYISLYVMCIPRSWTLKLLCHLQFQSPQKIEWSENKFQIK